MTRSIVTADVKEARRMVTAGSRTALAVKHEAHARHRRTWRDWLAKGAMEADEPIVKPGTGWEV